MIDPALIFELFFLICKNKNRIVSAMIHEFSPHPPFFFLGYGPVVPGCLCKRHRGVMEGQSCSAWETEVNSRAAPHQRLYKMEWAAAEA